MSDTPITDKVRAAIKESMTSRTQATYGTGYALRELDRLERELTAKQAECERLKKWIDAMNNSASIDAARGTNAIPAGYVLVPEDEWKQFKADGYNQVSVAGINDMLAAAKEK
jgi:hypothetical protein